MPTCTVSNDVELNYDEMGHGRPVVLIHGWPLSGKAFKGQLVALAAAGYQAIA